MKFLSFYPNVKMRLFKKIFIIPLDKCIEDVYNIFNT